MAKRAKKATGVSKRRPKRTPKIVNENITGTPGEEDENVDLDIYGANVDAEESEADHSEVDLEDDVVNLDDLDDEPISDDENAVDGMSLDIDGDESDEDEELDVDALIDQLKDVISKFDDEDESDEEFTEDDLEFDDEGEEAEGEPEGFESEEDEELEEETNVSSWVPQNKPKHDQLHKSGKETNKTSLPPGKGATGTENRPDSDAALKNSEENGKPKAKKAKHPGGASGKGKKPSNKDNWGGSAKTTSIDKVMSSLTQSFDIEAAAEVQGFVKLTAGDLNESDQAKAKALFTNAVTKRAKAVVQAYESHMANKMAELIEAREQATISKLDEFLDYGISNWIADNEVAIDEGLTTEISESFLTGMRSLFEEHNVEVPKSKIDLVEDLQTQLSEAEAEKGAIYQKGMKLRKENIALRKDKAISEVSQGLSALGAQKLTQLAESVEYRSQKQFTADLQLLKKAHLGSNRVAPKAAEAPVFESLTEKADSEPAGANSRVSQYAKIINRTARK